MLGAWSGVITGVVAAAASAEQANKAFEDSISGLPEDERQRRIDERKASAEAFRKELAVERRHQETLDAIRDSRGLSPSSMALGFLFGSLLD